MKTWRTILVICCVGISWLTSGQHLPLSPDLENKLNGKSNFFDIMKEVDNYYTGKNYHDNPKLLSEYKKWNRWAWFAVRHLDSKNEVNYNSASYLNLAKKMELHVDSSPSRSNSGVWSSVGPYSTVWSNNVGSKGIARVDRIAFHPTNSDIIIAASPAGGLWKTEDAGISWFSISGNIPNCGISGIVISEEDPAGNKIYILTGDGDSGTGGLVGNYGFNRNTIGVLVTTDGGAHWSKCGNSETVLSGRLPYKLIQVRGSLSRLLVGTDSGIYISNDFGNTWALSELPGTNIHDIEQHPTDNAVLYASTRSTVRKSTDSGANFNSIPTFTPPTGTATRTALAVTPAQPNEVYYLQCGTSNRLYRSTDSGNNYTSINSNDLIGGQYSYNCSFAVSRLTNQNMVVGGINLSSSTNNGIDFGNGTVGVVQNVPIPSNYLHSDIHDLAFQPNTNTLFAATDGGVFISNDNGINWTDRSNGLTCTQYYHMAGYDGSENLLVGGAQDNGTTYTTNGPTMNYCGTGDGFTVSFVSGDNNILYMVENTSVMRFTRSTNSRVSISPGTNADQTFFPHVIGHPTDANTLYVGYANSIWRSNAQGAVGSWSIISTTGTSNGGTSHAGGFAVSAAIPNRLYAANATTIRISNDMGDNWSPASGTTGWPASFGVITDLACRSNNGDELWVTTTGNNGANRILYTDNGGGQWFDFTGSLPNVPVYCIAYDDNMDVYVGTELGVYFMDASMSDWVPFYNDLPRVPVTDLFINESFGTIQASTFGRGIWESDLYSDCGPFSLLNGLVLGQNFHQSNGFIDTRQVVPGSVGNELRLRSPVKIIFSDDFRAFRNSYVHAIIGNCGQGVFDLSDVPESSFTKIQVLEAMSVK